MSKDFYKEKENNNHNAIKTFNLLKKYGDLVALDGIN